MKYSIIVCVYNGSSYIDSCFSSLLAQTYTSYEIIVIDDGSTDDSLTLLTAYEKKYKDKITVIHQENQGLSVGRNNGVKQATGDYLLFVDIDDCLKKDALQIIEEKREDCDLIKYSFEKVFIDGSKQENKTHFHDIVVSGEEAFKRLVQEKQLFEMACLYAYKTTFYKENQFLFTPHRYHEDFGLIPYVILKSPKVKLLDVVLYQYRQTEDSITRNEDPLKTVKRCEDIFYFYETLKKKIAKDPTMSDESKKLFKSFLANAVLGGLDKLEGASKEQYKKEIKEKKVVSDLLQDTFLRRLKYRRLKQKLK